MTHAHTHTHGCDERGGEGGSGDKRDKSDKRGDEGACMGATEAKGEQGEGAYIALPQAYLPHVRGAA